MATIYTEIKSIYNKYFTNENLIWEGKTDFRAMDQTKPDIAQLTALESQLKARGETNPYLITLYKKLNEASNEKAEINSFEDLQNVANEKIADENSVPDENDLGKNEETFSNKYPEVDEVEVLKKCYVTWLDVMVNKPFYKTIASFYDLAKMNQLNFVDRSFLWNFLKAISSCITHLLIEGAQREEAICLVDKYFDSLSDCLQSTIHAKSKDDVIQAFLYMVSFLGLNRDIHGDIETLDVLQSEDTSKKGESDSVGEF